MNYDENDKKIYKQGIYKKLYYTANKNASPSYNNQNENGILQRKSIHNEWEALIISEQFFAVYS